MIIRLVLSEVNTPVENAEIITAHSNAGHQRWSHRILANLLRGASRTAGRIDSRSFSHYSSR
jgi:hypothetical protein